MYVLALTQSISIAVLTPLGLLLIGILIDRKISEKIMDRCAAYRKAVELESDEDFRYGMETEVGNAFAYGVLAAENPITVPWAPGKYMLVRVVTERYERHEQTVAETETDADGHTHTTYRTEVYYSWDVVNCREEHVREIRFCGVVFPYSSIKMPGPLLHKTEYAGPRLRYLYYVLNQIMRGSIFTELSKNGISKGSPFYLSVHAKEAKERVLAKAADKRLFFRLIWFVAAALIELMVIMEISAAAAGRM